MVGTPQAEHQWLQQLVGQWLVQQECHGPDGTNRSQSKMHCRMVGGLWLISENVGKSDKGDPWTCIMTLGFDPMRNAYVGTFIGSMMTHLWPYKGVVDETGRRLVLDSEGPNMDGSAVTKYRDTIDVRSSEQWNLTGEILGGDDLWSNIIHSEHTRIS